MSDFFSELSNFFSQIGNWIARNWQLVLSTAIGIAVTIATAGAGAPVSFLVGGLAQSISEVLLNWFFPSGTTEATITSFITPISQMFGFMMGTFIQMVMMQMLMTAITSMMSMII